MPFVKGQSGNPGGRKAIPPEFRDRCKTAVNDLVINAWIEEVQVRGENWPKAAELLAAYAFGRPSQAVDVSGEMTNTIDVSDSLTALIAGIRQKRGK